MFTTNFKDLTIAETEEFSIGVMVNRTERDGKCGYLVPDSINPTQTDQLWFEHNELGDECGGGLWFEDGALIDYDGVFMLPKEVAMMLKGLGFDISYVEDEYD